jgi:hypothetical protein
VIGLSLSKLKMNMKSADLGPGKTQRHKGMEGKQVENDCIIGGYPGVQSGGFDL